MQHINVRAFGLQLLGTVFLMTVLACGTTEKDPDSNNMQTVDRSTYPIAPYGIYESDTLENLTFKNADGTDFTLNDIYADENNKLLLVSTSSGWCVSCIEEQAKLQERFDVWEEKGLFILLSTFEDAQFRAATPEYAGEWKERYNLTYKVVADPPFVFQNYYDKTATPMVMLVDVDTMSILKIMTGFDASVVDAIIEVKLGN